MRYNRIFSSKTVLFALLFSIFSFNSVLFAAQCDPFEEPVGGCHVCGGCGLSANDLYNATPFQEPSYSPSWTTVTSNGRVSAKQYLKFAVVEGNIYKWSTFNGEYGGEDYIADAVYSKQCLNDSDCNSDNLKCIGAIGNVYGFCNYPFDTELTLLKGDACSADAELIAFSNSEDDRNQTSLEWKATFTGNVVLLVTNFEFKFNSDNNGGYYHCSTNSNGFDTTVKWQRTSSEPCTTCGDVAKYRVDKSSVTPAEAPEWTPIQANEYALPGTVISSSSEHNWLFKPGSYVVFDVKESEIYRWSTCVSEFYDTQLSLFKGEGTAGNCGDFLAYGDDSRVSYKSGDVEYCPRGTKQTLLEWQANFTGTVTLLINEYNCYQCSSNNNDWSDCFTVTDNFKAEPGEGGVMTPVYDANGLPIKASPSDQSVTMTYLFSFPLDWQRYDCTKNCTSGSASAKVYDFCGNSGCSGSGWQSFGSGGSQTLSSGQFMAFSLKRGSKYLFEASDPNALITIRDGSSCSSSTVAQAKGRITYFADSEKDSVPDLISVFVSKADCNIGTNDLNYSYYGASGNAAVRYEVTTATNSGGGVDILIKDNVTDTQFLSRNESFDRWRAAKEACESYSFGTGNSSDDGGVSLDCPPTQCPDNPCKQGRVNKCEIVNDDKCRYVSESGNTCNAPACSDGKEYPKSNSTDSDYWGRCYSTGKTCAATSGSTSGLCTNINFNGTMDCATKACLQKLGKTTDICDSGYTMYSTSSGNMCYKPDGESFDLYTNITVSTINPTAMDITDYVQEAPDTKKPSITAIATNGRCISNGYIYGPETNKCYKCSSGYNYLYYYGGAYSCAKCPDGDIVEASDNVITYCDTCYSGSELWEQSSGVWKCRTKCNGTVIQSGSDYKCVPKCSDGSSAVLEGGSYKCRTCSSGTKVQVNGEWKCKQSCSGYVTTVNGVEKCFTNTKEATKKCPENWVTDPENNNYCRKTLTSGIGNNARYDYVTCRKGSLKNNDNSHTCNTSKPNSVDCDCFYDRCEETTLYDRECPSTWKHTDGRTYTVTSGYDEEGDLTCYFTVNGQTCGKAVGGWSLPNINQLYSLIDFDMYDPAIGFNFPHYTTQEISTTCDSSKPNFGDGDCQNALYICMNNKCVRNNWFWSDNTVVSENSTKGEFVWTVNLEDGRSYRAKKGCDSDEECEANADLNARSHRVICVKGSTFSGIFDSDEPANNQTFSGWVCDKADADNQLDVYFEIKDARGKEAVDEFLAESNSVYIARIGNLEINGIKYGKTDLLPTSTYLPQKATEIYNNCGFKSEADTKPHAFGVKWFGNIDDPNNDKPEIAEVILSLKDHECPRDKVEEYYNAINNGGNANNVEGIENCLMPPYKVTAYAVDSTARVPVAVEITPTERPFVFTNFCGDGLKSNDSEYTETCEKEDFGRICGYGNDDCVLCADKDITQNGIKACTEYNDTPPTCHDGILQSYYCEDGRVAEGYVSAGMNCEYYNFGLYNNIGSSEECDCPGDYLYLYNEDGTLTCENRLDEAVCPSYYRFGSNESDHCYICNRGCKREKVYKGFCGDGIPQNSNCSSVTQAGCQTVPGADEECDDGNDSNTDSCTNDCKKAKCGDGFIQAGENCDSGILNGHYATDCIGTESCPGCASSDCQGSGPSCGDSIVQHKNKCSDNAFLADNGFSSRADCEAKLASAEEVCDEGSNNGMPIKFQKFLDTPEAEGCAMEIKGVKQPVNAIHEKYAECVYKYQQYLNDNPGCSGDCTVARTAYCGDGKKDPGEECDEGLPVSNYNSGVYSIAEKENYNGKGYNHCKLDCSGTYKCSNGSLEKRSCTDTNSEDKCRSIGDDVTGVVYVKDANEKCDDGRYNGQYGYCAVGCQTNVGCGNGVSNECYKHNGSYCEEAEDCDKGDGNVTLDKAWSFSPGGTCVVENKELCKGNRWTDPDASDYIDVRCCVYGRYCGDGNVDNGFGVGISSSNEWRNRDNWTVSGLTVEEYPRELAMRFRLNGSEGTAELNVALPVNGKLRYIIEYNLMRSSTSDTPGGAKSGVNQYYVDSEGTTTLLVADDPNALNANPFFVVDSEGATHPNDTWSHHIARGISGFSQSATNMWLKVRDGGTDENPEFKETKAVKIFFKFTGNEGMDFYLRGLKFYTIEAGNPPSDAGAAYEMCDHDGNPKTVSSDYMTDCNDQCKWLNYCGDRIIQNQNCVDDDSCVSIQGAFEVCDNGTNQTNVYNGCEPGCLELGPRCGDGILDKGSCSCLGQENCDCNTPSGINTYEKCDKGLLNSNDAYSFNYDADMTLDLNLNSYRGDGCREDCMQPRCGDGIRDDVKKRIKRLLYKQKTDGNGALVYEKDKNGNLIYDRDNNLIPVYTTEPVLDENGNQMEEWVSEYVEECDCGDAKHYYDSTRTTTVYVKGELFYICQKNDAGEPLYNTTFSGRAAVCRPNCTVSRCGDGIKDPDEECDDGNFDDHDSCTSDCKLAKCGGEGDTADNKLAFKRSYLCEELLDISSAEMTKMRDRGVVDCGSQCSLFSTNMSGTNAAAKMREYFEAGVLHCCYNQKYNVGGIDDNNCEFIRNGEYVKPKKMVIDNCIANAWKNDGSSWRHFTEEECEAHEIYAHSFELCDSSCKDADCGCSEKYPGNETKIKQCIENNLYCDATCWNRIGKCGDGRVDNGSSEGTINAGEACDNLSAGMTGTFTDLYEKSQGVGTASGVGNYCTGPCVGTCSSRSPMCGGIVTSNCWQSGCTQKSHGGDVNIVSYCGDGMTDIYAGEECDEAHGKTGFDPNDYTYDKHWCNTSCKYNTTPNQGQSRCGDGVIQEGSGELCDKGENSEYCVANSAGEGCQIDYGSCGDGKIKGPGFTLYDSKITDSAMTAAGHQSSGPEYCDTNDTRTFTLTNAKIALDSNFNASTLCNNCKRNGSCGDGTRNPRFEGCDNGGNNATQDVTKNGKTCYAGCKSDPVGGTISFSAAEIKGWACDPDHPMVHPDNMVKIEVFDKNGSSIGSTTFKTTTDVSGTDYFGNNVNSNTIVAACGGGSGHGWTFNPNVAHDGIDWSSGAGAPFTIEVWAQTLDGGHEQNVLIGRKENFIMAMNCGDGLVSSCSVLDNVKIKNAEGSYDEVTWESGRVCHDSEIYDEGGCAHYGLTNGKECIDEACDMGTANSDNMHDCNSECQWTTCGDRIAQNALTGGRLDGRTGKEECDNGNPSNNVLCSSLSDLTAKLNTSDGDVMSVANTACDNPACNWKRSECYITSKCPSLSAVVSGWGGNYKANKWAQYIRYIGNPDSTTDRSLTYDRSYVGGTNVFQPVETVATYYENATSGSNAYTCAFKCTDNLKWSNGKCVPKTASELSKITCQSCPSPNDGGIWVSNSAKCNTTKQLDKTVTIDSNGDIQITPSGDAHLPVYGTTDNSQQCVWKCDNTSKVVTYQGAKKCVKVEATHTCSGKPANTQWVKVTKDGSDHVVLGDPVDSLTIPQTIAYESDGTTPRLDSSGKPVYIPQEVSAISLYDDTNSPASKINNLDTTQPRYCYYTCKSGYYYNKANERCESASSLCGNGQIESAHCDTLTANDTEGVACVFTPGQNEKCDDGGANGTYGKTTGGRSHCNSNCSGRIANGSKYFCGDGIVQVVGGTESVWDFESTSTPTVVSNGIIKNSASSGTGWSRMTASQTTIGAKSGSYAFCSMNSDYSTSKPYNPPASSNTTDDNTPSTSDAYISSEAIVVFSVKPTSSDQVLSFFYKGASEINPPSSDWDNFSFYINDVEQFNTKGGNAESWTSYVSPKLTANQTYQIKFRYKKDGSQSRYWDRYCIDDLKLSSSSLAGINAEVVNTTNYPGINQSAFTVSEECDGTYSRTNLCNRYLTMNNKKTNSSYYEIGTIGCDSSCKITGYSDACSFCGDGSVNGSENCGEGSDDNYYSGTAKGRCAAAFSAANNSTYTINIPGVYCFTVKGGDGNVAPWNGGYGCSGATVEGCYSLQKGDKITFKVGSVGASAEADSTSVCAGNYGGGGGGGASWLYLTRGSTNVLLLVAGGGGGSGWSDGSCGVGSNTNSATTAGSTGNGSDCSDNWNSDGTVVNTSNFTTSSGAGGDGGYYYSTTTSCGDKVCDNRYSCGGGGGGYTAGSRGSRDGGGGGGGSYVNTDSTYYSTGSSLTVGSTGITSPSSGSITVKKPNSNATCSTTNCQWSTSYSSCN